MTGNHPKMRKPRQQGFSLIEVLVSMAILTVGLVSLLGVFGMAMAATHATQQDMMAKQLASEAMESIFTARQTTQMTWDMVQNSSVVGGIFVDTPQFQPINNPGPDGIVGTADDAGAGAKSLILPGNDGIVGTSDDQAMSLANYQRSIKISSVVDSTGNTLVDLRTVTITIQYSVPQTTLKKNYIMTGYISQYR